MPRFKEMPMERDQLMLFGQSVDEALPADNDVRIFNEMMDYLDYSSYESRCFDTGCPAYPPKVMVKILGYAYSKSIFSSRSIEEALKVDVRFIWLSGGLKPDHNTIARFRKVSGEELSDLFKNSVKLCMESGLVFLNSISIDGSKIIANASKNRIYNKERIDNELERIDKLLLHADEVDRSEDKIYGNKKPSDLCATREKLKELATKLSSMSCKNVVSSDTESRVMKTRSNGKCPAYNLQASVDSENQVILAVELTQNEVDTGLLPTMIEQTEINTGLSPDISLADSGYYDESCLSWSEETKHNILMPILSNPKEEKRSDPFASKCFNFDKEQNIVICPTGSRLVYSKQTQTSSSTYNEYVGTDCKHCSYKKECCNASQSNRHIKISVVDHIRKCLRGKLETPEGKESYHLRQETVEPIFGQMKRNRGFTRLRLNGYQGALAETILMCLIHNIYKIISNVQAREYLLQNS